MRLFDDQGFSMVELAITVLVLGLLFTFSVPALNGFSTRHQLRTAIEDIAAQLRLERETAIATGNQQEMHFAAGYAGCGGCDYHLHNGAVVGPNWWLPKRVTYYWGAGTTSTYIMTKDGRSQNSGMIILQDDRGLRDTVSVQSSGLILTK